MGMPMSDASLDALVRDVILRALAALRERNALPSVDLPQVTLLPLEDARGYLTRVAVEMALAAAAADIENVYPEALAATISTYLAETVDLVPAYSVIERIEPASEGVIRIYLRAE
ncbi:MAG TPA: hypothetical protein VIC27_05360 [Ktedonobacterales bacterium]